MSQILPEGTTLKQLESAVREHEQSNDLGDIEYYYLLASCIKQTEWDYSVDTNIYVSLDSIKVPTP